MSQWGGQDKPGRHTHEEAIRIQDFYLKKASQGIPYFVRVALGSNVAINKVQDATRYAKLRQAVGAVFCRSKRDKRQTPVTSVIKHDILDFFIDRFFICHGIGTRHARLS